MHVCPYVPTLCSYPHHVSRSCDVMKSTSCNGMYAITCNAVCTYLRMYLYCIPCIPYIPYMGVRMYGVV